MKYEIHARLVEESMKLMEEYMRLYFQAHQILPGPGPCLAFRFFERKQQEQILDDLVAQNCKQPVVA